MTEASLLDARTVLQALAYDDFCADYEAAAIEMMKVENEGTL